MGDKSWGGRYPRSVFDIVGHALEHGMVDFADTEAILTPVRNKSKAEGYLNLCLQTGLLREPDGEYRPRYGQFVPTYRGRQFYRTAQEDCNAAMCELLGSIPYYRFHAELLLAELIMSTTLRSTPQAGSIIARVARVLPWFLGYRLLWIKLAFCWFEISSNSAVDWWAWRGGTQ